MKSQEQLEINKQLYGSPEKRKHPLGKQSSPVGTSQYKHVYIHAVGYLACLKRLKVKKYYKTEREAALRIDMALIKNGEQPVNILIKK